MVAIHVIGALPCDLIELLYKHGVIGVKHAETMNQIVGGNYSYSTQNNGMNHPTYNKSGHRGPRSSFHRCCPCCPCLPKDNKTLEWIGDVYWRYINWYNFHFGYDTHKWLVLLMAREVFEIVVQFVAFLNYNGLNVFDLNQVSLAYQESEIILFAWILGLNGLFCGILWLFYVYLHGYCYGTFFKYLMFLIDTIFDTMYALYPITVVILQTRSIQLSTIVGTLQATNLYVLFCVLFTIPIHIWLLYLIETSSEFVGAFVPIIYLATKSSFALMKSRNQLKKDIKKTIKHQKYVVNQQQLQLQTKMVQPTISTGTITEAAAPIPLQTLPTQHLPVQVTPQVTPQPPTTPAADADDQKIQQQYGTNITTNTSQNQKRVKKTLVLTLNWIVFITLFAFMFIGSGLAVIIITMNHFDSGVNVCNSPSEELLQTNPELVFWDQCVRQTLPFDSKSGSGSESEVNCNCREAKIDLSTFASDWESDSNITMSFRIDSMLKNWDMLEILYIEDDHARFSFNWTESFHYSSKYMKILHLNEIKLVGLSESIENWDNLEYFHLSDTHFPQWPKNFNLLNKISYLRLMDVTHVYLFPPNICQMTKLRAIQGGVSVTQIPQNDSWLEIPDCIAQLPILESVMFELAPFKDFPVSLFGHSNIAEIGFIFLNITLESFVSSSDGGYFNKSDADYYYDHSFSHNFYLELIEDSDYWKWNFDWNKEQTVYYLTGIRIFVVLTNSL